MRRCSVCGGTGWLEFLGAGMVHPKLIKNFGYSPGEVTGVAFGFGTTRMAAQWSEVSKLRTLYTQDLQVLTSLHRPEAS